MTWCVSKELKLLNQDRYYEQNHRYYEQNDRVSPSPAIYTVTQEGWDDCTECISYVSVNY